jgi:carbohydrate kinase (thermoresistant glucokinase family)
MKNPGVIFVMGVSGSGKTTIGQMLAQALHLPFYDGDDYHPAENVSKMREGIPLNDEDRYEWLVRLNILAKELLDKDGGIIACSALKESYRKILMEGISYQVKWIFLDGDMDIIKSRMEARREHYMPVTLLQSQFDALEIPEYAIRISIDASPDEIIKQITNELEY